MSFEHIEVLKKEHTGSYVVVDTNQPELARFGEQVGVIKTVNMNGKALVEFAETNNIGWFDIALEFLTSVPKPESKAASTKAKAAPHVFPITPNQVVSIHSKKGNDHA